MLKGKDVNKILSTTFITEPMTKKPRMGISLRKVLNPNPFHPPFLTLAQWLEKPTL
jgi:hypothetical protein